MTEPTEPAPPAPTPEQAPARPGIPAQRLYMAAAAGVLVGVALGTMMTRLQMALKGGQPCPGCAQREAIEQARLRQMLIDQAGPSRPEPAAPNPAAAAPPDPVTWADARPDDASVAE